MNLDVVKQGFLIGLMALGMVVSLYGPAGAASFKENYIPPEIVYAHDLSQKVAMPRKVNVNTASLPELQTLPGLSENIALKLMRLRPLRDIEDFYAMPWFDKREVQLLIDALRNRVEF